MGAGCNLFEQGILRLRQWTFCLIPTSQKSSTGWLGFLNSFPWSFWQPQLLAEIARGIGVPLRIDRTTMEGELFCPRSYLFGFGRQDS